MPYDGSDYLVSTPAAAQPTTVGVPAFSERAGPSWLARLERRLDRLGQLEVGWDTYGAPTISESARAAAFAFAKMLAVDLPQLGLPAAWPTPSGGVELEWERGEFFVSMEFDPIRGTWIAAYDTPVVEGELEGSRNLVPFVRALIWITENG